MREKLMPQPPGKVQQVVQPAIESALEIAGRVCLIISDEFTKVADAAKAFNDALAAKAAGIELEAETWDDDKCDPMADFLSRFEELRAQYLMDEMAEIAEDPAIIPQPRKTPRPPKRTGPVNKANYTANRPHRVARSSCRTIKR